MIFSIYKHPTTHQDLSFMTYVFNDSLYRLILKTTPPLVGDDQLIWSKFLKIITEQNGQIIIPFFNKTNFNKKLIYGSREAKNPTSDFFFYGLINLDEPSLKTLIINNYFIQENLDKIKQLIDQCYQIKKDKINQNISKKLDLLINQASQMVKEQSKFSQDMPAIKNYLLLKNHQIIEKISFLQNFNGNLFTGYPSYLFRRQTREINKKINLLKSRLKDYDLSRLTISNKITEEVFVDKFVRDGESLGITSSRGYIVVGNHGFVNNNNKALILHHANVYDNLKEAIAYAPYNQPYAIFEVDLKINKLVKENGNLIGPGQEIVTNFEKQEIAKNLVTSQYKNKQKI